MYLSFTNIIKKKKDKGEWKDPYPPLAIMVGSRTSKFVQLQHAVYLYLSFFIIFYFLFNKVEITTDIAVAHVL